MGGGGGKAHRLSAQTALAPKNLRRGYRRGRLSGHASFSGIRWSGGGVGWRECERGVSVEVPPIGLQCFGVWVCVCILMVGPSLYKHC